MQFYNIRAYIKLNNMLNVKKDFYYQYLYQNIVSMTFLNIIFVHQYYRYGIQKIYEETDNINNKNNNSIKSFYPF